MLVELRALAATLAVGLAQPESATEPDRLAMSRARSSRWAETALLPFEFDDNELLPGWRPAVRADRGLRDVRPALGLDLAAPVESADAGGRARPPGRAETARRCCRTSPDGPYIGRSARTLTPIAVRNRPATRPCRV